MNERISELVKQAGDYVNETYTGPVRSKTPGKIWEDGHIGWHTQFNQKFAELIVRECADLFVNQKYMVLNPHEPFAKERVRALKEHDKDTVRKIKGHFGVK
jgi:hypothetical protein